MLDHGLKGYGLYWYCLELIANKFDHSNITFELKHDARIIAKNTGETVKEVEDMMKLMIELGLFDQTEGIITCLKLGSRFESSSTSNRLTRDVIKQLKEKSCRSHDGDMTDKIRRDKIRLEENKYLTSFETFYSKYPKKVKRANAEKAWLKYKPDIVVVMKALEYQLSNDSRFRDSQYIPHPATWLNGKEWENEEVNKKVNPTYAKYAKEA
jgi:hypothetical protein